MGAEGISRSRRGGDRRGQERLRNATGRLERTGPIRTALPGTGRQGQARHLACLPAGRAGDVRVEGGLVHGEVRLFLPRRSDRSIFADAERRAPDSSDVQQERKTYRGLHGHAP